MTDSVSIAATEAAPDPVAALRAEMVTWSELADAAPPEPLIAGLLDRDSLAWLIGKSGSMKSFVALSLAACVATGRDWFGRRVERGPVVYVLAEGQRGATLRTRAWREHHGWAADEVLFLRRPVQVAGPEWLTLIEVCAALRPALVVVDTQARVTVGLRENSNDEMGAMIARLDMLRAATGACALAVHHIGRGGEDARGASAIDAAQDTEIRVTRVGGRDEHRGRISLDKQKEGSDDTAWDFICQVVELGEDPRTGRRLSSLVVAMDAFVPPRAEPWRDGLSEAQQRVLQVLRDHHYELGATKTEIRAAIAERWGAVPRSTIDTALNRLVSIQRVERVGRAQRWRAIDGDSAGDVTEINSASTVE